ncbi:MAG: hypothetical protein HQL56_07425 [Magnetococcales bacterium]|nr:hypothetical protein [Magnetococcales bacterium]
MSRLNNSLRLLGLAGLSLIGGACTAPHAPDPYPLISQPMETRPHPDLVESAYKAADAMLANLGERLDPLGSLVPASFVNQDNLDQTSAFGRLMARQISSRFAQRGFGVTEVKLRKNLFVRKDSGEFILSRDLQEIQGKNRAHAILAGTYTVAENRVYISAQVIRVVDRTTLASTDFSLALNPDIRLLLSSPN